VYVSLIRADFVKIPCFSLFIREIGRDGFAPDCPHRHFFACASTDLLGGRVGTAQREPGIRPDRMADDVGREAVTLE